MLHMAVMEMVEDAERLRETLTKYALKIAPPDEPFILASGRESNVYFDVKNATLAPEAVLGIGKLFWELVRARGGTAVGGLVAGAIPISVAVIAYEAMQGRNEIRAFYVRDEGAKTHGTKESLYQAFDEQKSDGVCSPQSVNIVVDDVLTTGKSVGQAMDDLLARGASVDSIIVLVNRQAGGAATLREKYGVPVIALYQMDGEGRLTYHAREVF